MKNDDFRNIWLVVQIELNVHDDDDDDYCLHTHTHKIVEHQFCFVDTYEKWP